ncbi:UDP-GlcNAc:betaGal beta-1,3-N-acetylglucosaminyltransferase 9-like [Eucyclogobius newberryi]|uniref:UDP-GlcNAc:betaGal beta-1,3-N-acetylglucosaminyltransferase 9-like n=1 Tax=Eucyclogobius newberryi TaxID=166745 RepID=UPI003B59A5BC
MVQMKRLLRVKGDVLCSLLLLLLFCLLFYARQVILSSGWDRPLLKLEMNSSTSSSRTLLGANASKPAQRLKYVKLVTPKPQSKTKTPQAKAKIQVKAKGKSKSRRKNAAKPTRPPLPTLPPFDFEGYLKAKDNRNFSLLIDQPDKCLVNDGQRVLHLLIAVKSVVADFDKRQVVRRTWGREGSFPNGVTIRTVFLLGVPRNRSALPLWDRLLAYESQSFKDILLWDFDDTFFNLTLKETHFLTWVDSSCAHIKFIFKGDADVYVNIENILELLEGQEPEQDLFVGDIIVNARPIRRRSSKYFVPEFVYGGGLYPSYAGGGGFVMSGFTARRLSLACQQVELFPIDDVFLGMCLKQIGVKPSRHQGFRTFGIPRPSAAPNLQTFDPCFYRELMVVHSLSVPQIWLMWNLLHDPDVSCHNRARATSKPFSWRFVNKAQRTAEADYADTQVFVTH